MERYTPPVEQMRTFGTLAVDCCCCIKGEAQAEHALNLSGVIPRETFKLVSIYHEEGR